MFDHISVLAGKNAISTIRDEGLDLSKVKIIAGASGSAKFLVLTSIDRVLVSMMKKIEHDIYLTGTSIGAFRMAAFCCKDPLSALDILEKGYIEQRFTRRPTKQEVIFEAEKIINAYIKDEEIDDLLGHPVFKISFLSNQCRGVTRSEFNPLLLSSLGMAAIMNYISRRTLGLFFKRALFCNTEFLPPFSAMDQFPMEIYNLNRSNFKQALLSSGSVPVVMQGISDIKGVPGVFRDGGIIDYHLDIPFLPEKDTDHLVLFPHFFETITPGWFDKKLNRQPDERNMKNVVLIAPSRKFVQNLPFQKIPDRQDFVTFHGNDKERLSYWYKVIDLNRQLGDEFFDAVDSGRIKEIVRPL